MGQPIYSEKSRLLYLFQDLVPNKTLISNPRSTFPKSKMNLLAPKTQQKALMLVAIRLLLLLRSLLYLLFFPLLRNFSQNLKRY